MEVGVIGKMPSFRWEVDTCAFRGKKIGENLLSPVFSYNSSQGYKQRWQIILFPKSENRTNQGYISVFLKSLNKKKISARYYISLLDQNNDKKKDYGYFSNFTYNKDRGWGKFVQENYVYDMKNNILKDNKMTILCSVMIEEESREFTSDETSRKLNHLKKFERMFTSEESSDVTVTTEDGNSLKLHKCILAASSTVFKAMFSIDMRERNLSILEIKDIRYKVLQELFRFIYTGEVKNINEIAGELLMAAEKYCIEELKELCGKTMLGSLTKENAVEYLNLALLNNIEKLKEEAIRCISMHVEELITARVFENLAVQHPLTYHKIMLEFFKKK